MNHEDEADDVIASLLRLLVDHNLSVALYDMTTIRAEGACHGRGRRA